MVLIAKGKPHERQVKLNPTAFDIPRVEGLGTSH